MANYTLDLTGDQVNEALKEVHNNTVIKKTAQTFTEAEKRQIRENIGAGSGTSITISNVSESTEDGGNNVVTFSDGKTLTVKNGKTGATGAAGANGTNGKSAYASAQDGGFTGTEAQFNKGLSVMGQVDGVEDAGALGIDTTVTQNSGNLITSGAVYSYIQSLDANEVKY